MGAACTKKLTADEPVSMKPNLATPADDDETFDNLQLDCGILTEELRASLKELGHVVSSELVSGMLSLLWPYMSTAASQVLNKTMGEVLDRVAQKYPLLGRLVQARNLDLGTVSPQIGAIYSYKRHKDSVGNVGIEICAELSWDANVDVDLTLGPTSFGINQVKMSGLGCIVFTPLMDKEPLVGGVHVFFVNTPFIDFKFKGLGGLSELQAVDAMLEHKIKGELRKEMVLPNRKTIRFPSAAITDMAEFRCPLPLGMFRIFVVKAENLPFGDFQADGSKSSDPFCKLRLGCRVGRTRAIQKTSNPSWEGDGPMDFLVHHERQLLQLNVFDHDHVKWNDLLGHLSNEHTVKSLLQSQKRVGPNELLKLKLDCSLIDEKWGGGVNANASVYLKVQYFPFKSDEFMQWMNRHKEHDKDDDCVFQERDTTQDNLHEISHSLCGITAGDVVLLSVKLYHATGLLETDVGKVQVRLRVGDVEILSRPCRKILMGDLHGFGKVNTEIMCSLHREGVRPETIAKCFGLQEEIVQELVTLPSGCGIGWNESLYTLVYDFENNNAAVTLELSMGGRQTALGSPKKLSSLLAAGDEEIISPFGGRQSIRASTMTIEQAEVNVNQTRRGSPSSIVDGKQLKVGISWQIHFVDTYTLDM